MNTITNVRINQTNNNTANYSKSGASNNIQFKGLNLRDLLHSKATKQYLTEQKDAICMLLNQPYKAVDKATKGANNERISFLESLSIAYNSRHNISNKTITEESRNIVWDIFNSITKPRKAHLYISKHYKGTMEDMRNVLQLMGNNKQNCNLACDFNKHVLLSSPQNDAAQNLLIDILSSKHVDTYAKNFAEYRPYLIDNRTDKDAIKKLDEMVSKGTFNIAEYNKYFETKNLFKQKLLAKTDVLNPETIKANYTEEGKEFLKTFVDTFKPTAESLKAGNDKDVLEMFKTTTKKNLPIRQYILNKYAPIYQLENSTINGNNKNIRELHRLFDNIDKNKHAGNFVRKLLNSSAHTDKLENLNEIIENIPNKELDIFFDNARNILNQTKYGEDRIDALKKHIRNPFYTSKNMQESRQYMRDAGMDVEGESVSAKIGKFIRNQFNLIRYKVTGGVESAHPSSNAKQEVKIINNSTPIANSVVNDIETVAQPKVIEAVINKTEKAVAKPVKISRTPSTAPNAKKLEVINDVNSIIEKKLGYKTLSEQKRDYAIKATKMRMQMLPEIFESIKETRAAERAAGKKLSVSNKDALNLYSLVKGRNKKLVSYMLKKRNADGTRMYNIKDIVKTIEQAETKVHNDKLASTRTYKAADAKAYYNTLLEAQIKEHGQLEKSKK